MTDAGSLSPNLFPSRFPAGLFLSGHRRCPPEPAAGGPGAPL